MSSVPDTSAGPLRRAWAAWERFWFLPADPTPLCLMRIIAGLLVLYVHIAYTFDLHAFFGPDGWYGHEQANRERREFPIFVPQSSWGGEPRFRMPQVAEHRRALRVFMENAARDREKQANMSRLLRHLPTDMTVRMELLRYLQNLPDDFADRDAELLRMTKAGTAEDKSKDNAPPPREIPAFLLSLSASERDRFRADAHAFLDLLPPERLARNHLLGMLQSEGTRDPTTLIDLIAKLGRMTEAARTEYLDYCERWTCAPDDPDIVAKGHLYYSPFYHIVHPRAIELLHGLHLVVMVLFTVGFCTRVTGVLTWLGALAYIQRNPLVLFGQDTMMNLCLFYLMLSPCGEVWSVDWLIARYRAGRAALRGGQRPAPAGPRMLVSANFAIRLLQVQYCLMYLSAGLAKLKGDSWWNGTAVWYTMTNPEFSPLHIGPFRQALIWLCQDNHRPLWELYMNSTNVFTLVLEIGFPFLVWTRLRPVMVAGAVLLHLGIATNMGLVVFSLFMFTLLLAWMPADAIRRVFARPPARMDLAELHYSAADARQVKTAAAAYALDVWGQVAFVEQPTPGEPARLVVGGEASSGYALAQRLTRTLALSQPVAWLLLLPGVAQLGRAIYGDAVTAAPATADPNRKRAGQKPVATR